MRLLLDEHIDKVVAARLRDRGFDVVAVTEDEHLVSLSDAQLLERAVGDRRAIVTYNTGDFRALIAERLLDEEHHFGAIFLTEQRFPQGKRYIGALIDALATLLEQIPADGGLLDREVWLAP